MKGSALKYRWYKKKEDEVNSSILSYMAKLSSDKLDMLPQEDGLPSPNIVL